MVSPFIHIIRGHLGQVLLYQMKCSPTLLSNLLNLAGKPGRVRTLIWHAWSLCWTLSPPATSPLPSGLPPSPSSPLPILLAFVLNQSCQFTPGPLPFKTLLLASGDCSGGALITTCQADFFLLLNSSVCLRLVMAYQFTALLIKTLLTRNIIYTHPTADFLGALISEVGCSPHLQKIKISVELLCSWMWFRL